MKTEKKWTIHENLYVSEEMHAWLKDTAKKFDTSVSGVVRQVLKLYMNKYKKTED